ncbi:hypothetical protein [Bacillus rhizoplanae]|uniref:hypothetical protein n=1 Tax=Bacillus rhizoplanae TaxID=2880966 RepID=UPI003D1D82B4
MTFCIKDADDTVGTLLQRWYSYELDSGFKEKTRDYLPRFSFIQMGNILIHHEAK